MRIRNIIPFGLGIGLALFSGCIFSTQADLGALKTRYPAVRYDAEAKDSSIELVRVRPATWVDLGDISKMASSAVLISEDAGFYQHDGIDPSEIKEAIKKDIERHRYSHGASTVTQQVVRNIYLSKEKSILRKIREIDLALRLEKVISKRRILEIYFNIAEWGDGIYGIGAAAQFYFHKSPRELTAREGAFLAMLLPSPERYAQSFRQRKLTDYARHRIDVILTKLEKTHILTEDECAAQKAAKLSFEAD